MGNLKFVFLFTQNGPGGIVFSSSNEDEYFFLCSFVQSFFFSYNKILSIMMKIIRFDILCWLQLLSIR